MNQLCLFTGTTRYHRISRRHLLTDGTQYLAAAAGAYWLMDAAASHLDEIGTTDWFVLIKLQVHNTRAGMIYEDVNGKEYSRQEVAFTDFPFSNIQLYACWDREHWVIMLYTEYLVAHRWLKQAGLILPESVSRKNPINFDN